MLADERPSAAYQIDLLALIDQLQEVIETSPRIWPTDRVLISQDLLLDLVDAIRGTLPRDLIEADRVLQERERLVEDAREEVEQLLEGAREQSKFMLQDHHIVKAAEVRAERLLSQARREADEIAESADEYVQNLFVRFEEEAVRIAAEIRRTATQRS